MGLAVSTGVLVDALQNDAEMTEWLTAEFAVINELLADAGHDDHVEPRETPASIRRDPLHGMPYSWLHFLRRVYAHTRRDDDYRAEPLADDEDPTDDPVLEEETETFESHLLTHSDAEGYYVPVDFDEVLFDVSGELPGGMLGSSQRLQQELIDVASALGIRLSAEGELDDAEVARLVAVDEADGLYRELIVWLCLYEASRESLAHGVEIRFG